MATLGHPVKDRRLMGRRDAFHAPCVAARAIEMVHPGMEIRFVDDAFIDIQPARSGLPMHGVVDPFLKRDVYYDGDIVWVLLAPDMTSNLVHHFDLAIPANEPKLIEQLKKQQEQDPGCAGCWRIEDGRLVRD